MDILVINAGSSSLKYQLIDMANESVKAKGLAERIGIDGSNLKHKPTGKDDVYIEKPMKSHIDAISMVLNALTDKDYGVISDMREISAVGHRVVQGGTEFYSSVIIDDKVLEAVKANVALAPLHIPANLMGIEACMQNMPTTPQIAVFDTAFHQTIPEKAYLYGIPYEYYEKYKMRRYGYHGTSHKYVSRVAAKQMGRNIEDIKIITCHLGNGGSITAVDGGKSVDTSMGLTPLEGILMGTRCGDIDPAAVEYLINNTGLTVSGVIDIFNKKSGLLGVSGIGSDMRDIIAGINEGNKRAAAAYELFKYRILKYIGAYAAVMNGVDCIVFTAGIGENNPVMCMEILENLSYLGVKTNNDGNYTRGDCVLSADDSRVKAYVISTNEELTIARDTLELVK